MTDIRLIYVTTQDQAEARTIAHSLLEKKLIACANILPEIESLYRWEGEIKSDHEAVLILKTRADFVSKVTETIIALHSYKNPCVLSIEVESGSDHYLSWLRSEVGQRISE